MRIPGKTLLETLNTPDYELLSQLGPEESIQHIIYQATQRMPDENPKHLSNTELLGLYQDLNTSMRQKKEHDLPVESRNVLDDYLIQKGLVDTKHFLAHLPRIQANNIMNPPVEKAIVGLRGFSALQKDSVTLKGPVYGLQEHNGELQLDIDAGLPPSIVQANPIYVFQIQDYQLL